MSAGRKASVTGIGVLSPLGCDYATFAAAVRAGDVSAAAPFPDSQTEDPVFCHLLSDPEALTPHLSRREKEPLSALATATVGQALSSAGLPLNEGPHDDIGLVMKTVLGPSAAVESYVERLQATGPRTARPAHFVDTLLSMPASRVGIALALRGSTAVLGGSSSLELALDWVRSGREHTIVAGAGEYPGPKCLRYFQELASRSGTERPAPALGAAFFVLEESVRARKRGVQSRGELLGAGAASEPQDVAQPWSADPDGCALASAMRASLADADVEPETVSTVALASGDDAFESIELAALRGVFGRHAESLSLLRPKRQLGEALGASATLAAAATLATLEAHDGARPAVAMVNAFEMGGGATSVLIEVASP